MRAKIHVKDGNVADRREHVEHYIETLDDHDLAKQLTLLRLDDVLTLELTLHTHERMQKRKCNLLIRSGKFRSRSASPYSLSPSKPARAGRPNHVGGESSSSESDICSAESDEENQSVYSATTADYTKDRGNDRPPKPRSNDRERDHERAEGHKSCTHCGFKRHGGRGCWKRLTCQKCERRGHLSDKCFYECSACGEVHDGGNCPMEKFYNMLLQEVRVDQTAGMLPPDAEKMLH
uniref:CCHC-type domain-containing protein n=1 Tax=Peronospora matthiolae TaxID=2874970 RepID=A0AAV1TP89_9STRA